MVPAADLFAHKLAATPLKPPAIAVLHNVTVAQTLEPEQIRDLLRRQLYSPVRWVETIRTMAEAGVTLLLEMGPGKVLAGLGKRIDGRVSGLAVLDPTSLDVALEAIADVDG
jgi:[acyl-carrier-protein] S-malonyltransferase